MVYNHTKKDELLVWVLFIFAGWSYGSFGEIGKQILFYVTLGGLGVWTIYRLFTLGAAIKEHNRAAATAASLTQEDLVLLGLI